MKKLSSIVLVCVFLTLTSSAFAQFTNYNWKDYGVSFAVPSTHRVLQNTADEFASEDNNTSLHLFPYNDASATPKGMIVSIVNELPDLNILQEGAYKVGGYDGYWITCEESEHPGWQYWYIGFIDPNSDVNFYAIIGYKKNNAAAVKLAEQMSYKFKKI